VLFNSLEYLIFLVLAFVGFWGLARARLGRTAFLLGASYLFYMSWNPAYIVLIIASTVLDYFCGGAIARAGNERARKGYLALSLVGNLGMLALFKYTNFAWSNLLALAELGDIDLIARAARFGLELPRRFPLLLPVGISFYTFQTLSYSLDIYRGKLQPTKSFREFALYVAFFPQLVAGPIVRAREFLPQLDHTPRLTAAAAGDGIFLILRGMIKKVALADFLAVNFVDRVFDTPAWFSSVEVLVALVAYSLQIYFDFSAYTDIARGSAKLLGFELPENFRRPYQAQTIAEFWQRWHMTLTTWIRDYLYIPLGGSRSPGWRRYRNVLVTWLIMGLWHGAGWNYVLWGLYFGVLLLANHVRRHFMGLGKDTRSAGALGALRTVGVILLVSLSWLLFRAESLDKTGALVGRLALLDLGMGQVPWQIWLALGVSWGIHLSPAKWAQMARTRFARAPVVVQAVAAAAVGAALLYLADDRPVPFIYFQF